MCQCRSLSFFFFFNDTATTEIYTLSLHDALPISTEWLASIERRRYSVFQKMQQSCRRPFIGDLVTYRRHCFILTTDRKSTRLNSSHSQISYAVFCLKKKQHTLDNKTHLRNCYHAG